MSARIIILLCAKFLICLQIFCTSFETINSKLPITWSNRQGLTLTPITTGVWSAERPFLWNNIDVGGRSVVARTTDGNLLVHSPVEWTENLDRALRALGGEVKYIVSPNYEHLKYAEQWAGLYPNAIKCSCPGLPQRMPTVNWDLELGKGEKNLDGVDTCFFDCEINPFTSEPFFNEVVFFHEKSKSLFMADTFWNYPSGPLPNYFDPDQGTGTVHICSKMPTGCKEGDTLPSVEVPFGTSLWKFGMDKIYLPFYKNFMVGSRGQRREKYEKAVRKLLSWEPEVIIPCHGDVIKGKEKCKAILIRHFL